MTPKTLKALQVSIKSWEATVNTLIRSSCSLCYTHRTCKNCPVKLKVKRNRCYFTPFYAAAKAINELHEQKYVTNVTPTILNRMENRARVLAQKEVNFLRSLLPENNNAKS